MEDHAQEPASHDIVVIISGGFWSAYHEVIEQCSKAAGVRVKTLSGSSQGSSSKTIRAQLLNGVEADIVILSREGLAELDASGLVQADSSVALAKVLLGAAVRSGDDLAEVDTLAGLTDTLLRARCLGVPESTSGKFVLSNILPQLGVVDRVVCRAFDRGTDSTSALARGDTDLAIGPLSELVGQPGVEVVGPLPSEVQLDQVFVAAITSSSKHTADAKALITCLASENSAAAIVRTGMTRVEGARA